MALAWGGYKNGQIPLTALTDVGNGQSLRSDVARQLDLMLDAYVADTGNARPHVNSGYRSLDDQQWMLDHPAGQLVAAVGFSTHGWGITPDLSDTGRHPVTPFSAWLDEHAADYGFRRTIASESWHYQGGFPATITAALDRDLITDQEHDMSITRYLYTPDAGDGKPAYGIFGEQVPGGSRITRGVNTAEVWGAIWGTEKGAPWKAMTKAQWPRLIAEAKVINADWVKQQTAISKAAGGTTAVNAAAIDYGKLAAALASAIPAATVGPTAEAIATAVNDDAANRLRA